MSPVTVGGFLLPVGHGPEASRKAIERGLERIEEWYVAALGRWGCTGDQRRANARNQA